MINQLSWLLRKLNLKNASYKNDRVTSKLNLPPSNQQLMPVYLQIPYSYLLNKHILVNNLSDL
jgi:hypothetical protein